MYNHKEIEARWQKFWQENKIFASFEEKQKPKYYCLDMFPYPSGAGLHVGHPEGYTANDIIARYKHAKGFSVLHPMGWDAFWLPAENYAIITGTHPRITTDKNIATFKKQIESLGFSYDWDREIDTTDPKYYKWTQWIFLKLFEHGLAYEQDLPINYCPSCKTGLANEEVLNDFTCERCGEKVEKKKIRQWVLAITKYAERLLQDVDTLDWPEGIKDMQRNWIGKSEGCEFRMERWSEDKKQMISEDKNLNDKTYKIIWIAMKVQNELWPWLEEKVYKKAFKIILEKEWFSVKEEVKNPILFEWEEIGFWKIDLLIDDAVVIELKSQRYIKPEHYKQLRKYLNQSTYQTGFLMNFYWQKLDYKRFEKDYHKISSEIIWNKSSDNLSISVYTTRIDTVFGMSYAVLAPDHPQVMDFITPDQKEVCLKYIDEAKKKSDQDRTAENKEKTGVFTGSYVINPFNNEKVPLWIADYVLGNYGTWAVMAVPAHDERDFEFAKKYDLEIKQSIAPLFVWSWWWKEVPQEAKQTKKVDGVAWIIENENGEILLLNWKKTGRNSFVTGKVWKEEDPRNTVIREIEEETGYRDLEIVENPFVSFLKHYHKGKDYNVEGYAYGFHLKLLSDKREKIAKEEEEKHSFSWYTKEEAEKKINITSHDAFFSYFFKKREAYKEDGVLVNSQEFDWLSSAEARDKLTEFAEKNWFWTKKINYKLRDWLFSRQRYWGEPIPLIHISNEDYEKLPHISDMSEDMKENTAYIFDKRGTPKRCKNCDCTGGCVKLIINGKAFSKVYDWLYGKIICDYTLPLKLPQVDDYEPSGDGNSPLAKIDDFVHVKLADNLSGKRETNTMPQWGGSCWYYLRYMDPDNDKKLVNPEIEKYWGQVDSYVWGAEHAVLHLLYARFWHKFLFDIGVVSSNEPFYRLRNQWLILAHAFQRKNGWLIANDLVEEKNGKYYLIESGEEVNRIISKMSKSLKNVINPDEIVERYWADALRLYEMYMADFKDAAPWDTKWIVGVSRFLDKVWRLFMEEKRFAPSDEEAMKTLHKTIKKVSEDIENYKFNTAIAQLMICVNMGLPKDEKLQAEWSKKFLVLLHPFAPHIAEELYQEMRKEKYTSFYFATGNKQKITRLQMVIEKNNLGLSIADFDDFEAVEENWKTELENALQKLEPYTGKNFDFPIIATDSWIYFEGMKENPTHIKRMALNEAGLEESNCSQEQIAEAMSNYYKNLAKEHNGTLDFYYKDAWVIMFPDGNIISEVYKREYILTSEEKGERDIYFPMRNFYQSKITGKYACDQTEEDTKKEFECMAVMMKKFFSDSLFFTPWPDYDEAMTIDDTVKIGVQVNGKLRGDIEIAKDESQENALKKAKENPQIAKWLEEGKIIKEIYVPWRIVNIIVK